MSGSTTPSLAVIKAVAKKRGKDPSDLPEPLAEAINPDALDQLFTGITGPSPETGKVCFTFNQCEVTVHVDGQIEITAEEM